MLLQVPILLFIGIFQAVQSGGCCCRNRLLEALSPLGTPGDGIGGGEGAIYLWARLPTGEAHLPELVHADGLNTHTTLEPLQHEHSKYHSDMSEKA